MKRLIAEVNVEKLTQEEQFDVLGGLQPVLLQGLFDDLVPLQRLSILGAHRTAHVGSLWQRQRLVAGQKGTVRCPRHRQLLLLDSGAIKIAIDCTEQSNARIS